MPLLRRHLLRLAIAAAGLAGLVGAAGAQNATGPDAATLAPLVDRIVGEAVANRNIPGAIVGVSWHGRRSYFGYGATPYSADTIVEIGSITKVFTTALFAEALIEGRMTRDAPLQSYWPGRRLRPCTAQVTALQLADFTSGMPTLPGNVPRRLAEMGIEHYSTEAFLDWVSHWESPEAEGCGQPAPYRYSNAGIGLLGYLVAERLGAPWPELVHERITRPLRMTSTALRIRPDQADRRAQGFGQNGEPVIPWPVFAWYPAGGLRSTASDMLSFGEAALGRPNVEGAEVPPLLTRALRDAMESIYPPEGQTFGQGMAWIEEDGDPEAGQRPVFLNAGGTDGFNSVIVVNPGKNLAIFFAASHPKANAPRLGVRLSRQIR